MKAGVNVGNTFEAVWEMTEVFPGDETCWGNLPPNKVLFEGYQSSGLDVVRGIPVAYSHQFEDAATYLRLRSVWILDKGGGCRKSCA